MNADAYLKKYGWRGTGHSLDRTDRGITKPLLISHKQDQLGLGKQKAAHSVSDQWWMRAFDESLQNIGTGKESTLNQVRKVGISRGGLYSFFVKGEGLTGTIEDPNSAAESSQSASSASQSGASTPATSASESSSDSESDVAPEPPAKSSKKRKRAQKEDSGDVEKRQRLEKPKDGSDVEATEATGVERFASGGQRTKIHAVVKRINREMKAKIKARAKAGEFKDVSSAKSGRPKKVKMEQQTRQREAQKLLKKEMIADAMLRGDLPTLKKYRSREDALKSCERDLKLILKAGKLKDKGKKNKDKKASGPKQTQTLEKSDDTAASAKIAKLSEKERAQYEERAAKKGQTLEQYVLRRIQKKEEQRSSSTSSAGSGTDQPAAKPETGALFFTDLEGDANILSKLQPGNSKHQSFKEKRQSTVEKRVSKRGDTSEAKEKKSKGNDVERKKWLQELALSGETAI